MGFEKASIGEMLSILCGEIDSLSSHTHTKLLKKSSATVKCRNHIYIYIYIYIYIIYIYIYYICIYIHVIYIHIYIYAIIIIYTNESQLVTPKWALAKKQSHGVDDPYGSVLHILANTLACHMQDSILFPTHH